MTNAELFKKVYGIYAEEFWAYPEEKMLDWLTSNAPTADVVERKKGRWNTDKESPEYATCSLCGHCDWDCTESEYFKYCPNCGAKMEADDGEIH